MRLTLPSDTVRDEVLDHLVAGRALGARIDRQPGEVRAIAGFPLAGALNRLGLPVAFGGAEQEAADAGLAHRCALYEALGFIDPNLAFGAPGPGMAGFVVAALGNESQTQAFFSRFAQGPAWSFFALTEPDHGSDAGAIRLAARPVAGGYRLTGEKYLVGHGVHADIGIVFARFDDGPLGVRPVLMAPADAPGFRAQRLPVHGCRGSNVSRLVLDDVFVPDDDVLGAHLRPTERFRRGASATFDALRPCIGALALGVARGALARAVEDGLLGESERGFRESAALTLDGLSRHCRELCAALDAGARPTREAGFAKALAYRAAAGIVREIVLRAPPGAAIEAAWLARARRDLGAFEYAEGVSTIHRLGAADLFRGGGDDTRH